jgi:hypothetical protein
MKRKVKKRKIVQKQTNLSSKNSRIEKVPNWTQDEAHSLLALFHIFLQSLKKKKDRGDNEFKFFNKDGVDLKQHEGNYEKKNVVRSKQTYQAKNQELNKVLNWVGNETYSPPCFPLKPKEEEERQKKWRVVTLQ